MIAETQSWNIFVVDDDKEICEQIKRFLESQKGAITFTVDTSQQFSETLTAIKNRVYDLLILDVRLGPIEGPIQEEAGVSTLNEIKKNRFIPVIFYTARPVAVKDSTPPVWVVQKDDGLEELLKVVNAAINTKLPSINRALLHHVERIQCDYMWGFVTNNWKDLGENDDKISLAYFLARRLATSLSGSGISEMAQELGDVSGGIFTNDPIHPLRYYVIPPINQFPCNGNIYFQKENNKYWVLLTPSCDLIKHNQKPPKAENVILAECLLLQDQNEYKDWKDNKKEKELLDLIKNNRGGGFQPDRFYFLPGPMKLPNLVVDFQKLLSMPFGELGKYKCIATLDSPFAEALLSRFTRYFGRIGTPDLNDEIVKTSLK